MQSRGRTRILRAAYLQVTRVKRSFLWPPGSCYQHSPVQTRNACASHAIASALAASFPVAPRSSFPCGTGQHGHSRQKKRVADQTSYAPAVGPFCRRPCRQPAEDHAHHVFSPCLHHAAARFSGVSTPLASARIIHRPRAGGTGAGGERTRKCGLGRRSRLRVWPREPPGVESGSITIEYFRSRVH